MEEFVNTKDIGPRIHVEEFSSCLPSLARNRMNPSIR